MKFLILYLATISFYTGAHEAHHHGSQELKAGKPISEASVYDLKGEWKSHSGSPIELRTLSGKKVVLAMVYLTCKSACPILTADMKRIASQVPPRAKGAVSFVLVSIDPDRDTVAQLRSFHDKHKLGPEWTVLTGTERTVRELAAVLGVQYKREKDGEFQHSNTITLLNERGVVKAQVQGLNADSSELSRQLL